jgi:hypothetical protein
MTKTELKPLYAEAAARSRATPSGSELAVWFSYLGHLDIRDLKLAIDDHFAKSQWMPKESELRPLAEQAKRGRMTQSNSKTTYARWECPTHRGVIVGDFIEASDRWPRRCPKVILESVGTENGKTICAARMTEIFREDNFATGNSGAIHNPAVAR